MEIKFEKNGTVVTINGILEGLVGKDNFPEFVENMLWHIGQADVMKKRKNTVYGETKKSADEYTKVAVLIEGIEFADEASANLAVMLLKDKLYRHKLVRFVTVDEFINGVYYRELYSSHDSRTMPEEAFDWGWSDISSWKVWHETDEEKSDGGYHIWIPGLKRKDESMVINESSDVNYINFNEEDK